MRLETPIGYSYKVYCYAPRKSMSYANGFSLFSTDLKIFILNSKTTIITTIIYYFIVWTMDMYNM